jgi:serpin B
MRSRLLSFRPGAALLAAALAAATPARGADDPAAGAVAAANTAFAFDLYRQLSSAPGNLVFSPYSVSDVLGMALVGARGQTAAEMAATLHLKLPPAEVAAGFANLAERFDAAGNDRVVLVTANSLWVQPQTPLDAEYLKVLRIQFRAEAVSVDFLHAAEAARTRINDWVADKTRGKITDLIGPGFLNDQTRMVLGNAIYFKGRWAHQFKAESTRAATFRISPHVAAMVPTMQQTADFHTVHLAGLSLLELPYEGSNLSMVILLPDAVDGLAEVERQAAAGDLRVWLAQLDFTRVTKIKVMLPRFTARETFRLAPPLSRMGMPAAFDRTAADFSGMTGTRDLFLSDVVHQAYVNVDEEGTEAAAATGAVMAAFGIARVPEFRVDHPFVFLIRDNATGTLLFLGRVVDPR